MRTDGGINTCGAVGVCSSAADLIILVHIYHTAGEPGVVVTVAVSIVLTSNTYSALLVLFGP